jgi:uncharacterized integral membrane protein (TIGR00698 family)
MRGAVPITFRSYPAIKFAVFPAVPGLAITIAVGLTARVIAQRLPVLISEVPLAVLLGIVVANTLVLPKATAAGIKFSVQRVLRLGIVLLGARLSLGDVVGIGAGTLGLVVLCMSAALTTALLLGRAFRLPPRLALLIGVGTCICGNSAIIATAPVIEADERDVGFAIATITLFGTVAVFLYPLIGHALGLTDNVFGVWSGVAVNDTGQVLASSAAFSSAARDVATVVKLVRNTFMAPLILLIAWWWGQRAAGLAGGAAKRGAAKAFPLFVLGFILMAALRTSGVISGPVASALDGIAQFCILIALAGVGLNTNLARMRVVGGAPFYVGFGTAILLASLSLVLILALQVAPRSFL